MEDEKVEEVVPRIVSAVAFASGQQVEKTGLRQRIDDAVAAAILECNAEGISTEDKNSDIIRARMMAARERVLAEDRANVNGEQE